MAGKGSAEKRQRQNETHRASNRMARSTVRTSTKKFMAAVEEKNVELADTQLRQVVKLIDTYAGKGLFHKNKAARQKSRLYARLNSIK